MKKNIFNNLTNELFNSERFWNFYLTFYDHINSFPPYQQMIEDVYKTLDLDNYSEGHFLDAGCGTGNFIIYSLLRNRNLFFLCFDSSRSGIEKLKEKIKKYKIDDRVFTNLYFFQSVLPYEDSKFDGIVAINFIQYLDSQKLDYFIKESARVLKPKGKIVIVYPSSKIKFKDGYEWFKKFFRDLNSIREKTKYIGILTLIGVLNIPMKLNLNTYIYSIDYVESLLKQHNFRNVKSKPTYYSDIVTLTYGTLLK